MELFSSAPFGASRGHHVDGKQQTISRTITMMNKLKLRAYSSHQRVTFVLLNCIFISRTLPHPPPSSLSKMLLYSNSHFKRVLHIHSEEFKFFTLFSGNMLFIRSAKTMWKHLSQQFRMSIIYQIIHKWSMVARCSLNEGLFQERWTNAAENINGYIARKSHL